MNIKLPRNFVNYNCIPEFLSEMEIMFKLKGKLKPDVVFDCTKIRKLSSLGALLLYKSMDYSIHNNCFTNPEINGNELFLESAWNHYGFSKYLKGYVKPTNSSDFNGYLKFELTDKFVIAPQPLSRKEHNQVNKILQTKFTPILNEFYSNEEEAVRMIFGCVSEIIGNFWEHANDDTRSLLVAEGNRKYIEITCADNGKGIISTMRNSGKYKSSSSSEYLLRKALTKGVTSKPFSSHMGYGLWIIDQIVSLTKGKFFVYSEGVYYGNNAGKELMKKCGFWKGTIIYLFLPIDNPVLVSQVVEKELLRKNDILLNFG